MDLGMPTLLEMESFEETAALANRLGLQFIELNMNLPAYQPDAIDAGKLRAEAEAHNVYCTIHLEEGLNAADFNPLVAESYRETVRRSIRVAKALGCPILNMHLPCGVYFTLPEQRVFLFDRYKARYLDSLERFRDDCAWEIGDADITIAIENTDGYPPFQVEALDLLLQSPAFGLTFDVGHNHVAGGADESIVRMRQNRLVHMHLHDALGRRSHLPLGSGSVDLPRYLRFAAERDCRIVLETKTVEGLRQSVAWVRRRQA